MYCGAVEEEEGEDNGNCVPVAAEKSITMLPSSALVIGTSADVSTHAAGVYDVEDDDDDDDDDNDDCSGSDDNKGKGKGIGVGGVAAESSAVSGHIGDDGDGRGAEGVTNAVGDDRVVGDDRAVGDVRAVGDDTGWGKRLIGSSVYDADDMRGGTRGGNSTQCEARDERLEPLSSSSSSKSSKSSKSSSDTTTAGLLDLADLGLLDLRDGDCDDASAGGPDADPGSRSPILPMW